MVKSSAVGGPRHRQSADFVLSCRSAGGYPVPKAKMRDVVSLTDSHSDSMSFCLMAANARTVYGQRVRLVAPAAIRVRRQERRIGLDQQPISGDERGGLAQRRRHCVKVTGPANDSRYPASSALAGHRRVAGEAVEDHRSPARPRRAARRRSASWASRSWIISALPVRLARSMCQAKACGLDVVRSRVPVVVETGLADRDHLAVVRQRSDGLGCASSVRVSARVGCSADRGVQIRVPARPRSTAQRADVEVVGRPSPPASPRPPRPGPSPPPAVGSAFVAAAGVEVGVRVDHRSRQRLRRGHQAGSPVDGRVQRHRYRSQPVRRSVPRSARSRRASGRAWRTAASA